MQFSEIVYISQQIPVKHRGTGACAIAFFKGGAAPVRRFFTCFIFHFDKLPPLNLTLPIYAYRFLNILMLYYNNFFVNCFTHISWHFIFALV